VAQGSVDELSANEDQTLNLTTHDSELARNVLSTLGIDAIVDGKNISAHLSSNKLQPQEIIKSLVEAGVGVISFGVHAPTLEERFVRLTGEGFEVA
jgi:ABC-2 type transport system ATP-binding protein